MNDVMVESIGEVDSLTRAWMMVNALSQVGGDVLCDSLEVAQYALMGSIDPNPDTVSRLGVASTPEIARAMLDVVFAFGGYAELDYLGVVGQS